MQTIQEDIKEMMKKWNFIEQKAKEQFPNATKEEIYKITSDAMNYSLGIKKG